MSLLLYVNITIQENNQVKENSRYTKEFLNMDTIMKVYEIE